jgi:oxygen-independent coproporphyrinogen-3 oxidase
VNKTNPNHTPLTQFTKTEKEPQENFSKIGSELTSKLCIDRVSQVKSAYIHIPFCFHKCNYCDFYSVLGEQELHGAFVKRLELELEFVGHRMNQLKSIFIGGGTPTLLSPKLFKELLDAVNNNLPVEADVEFTVEANPETVTPEIAKLMVENGVNRVSIGAQSFDKKLLKTLERWHEPSSVFAAVEELNNSGIDNLNLDLIYGIPNQTINQVESDLNKAMSMNPKHLSCYALTYEPNTPMYNRLRDNKIKRVENNVEADMFRLVGDVMRANKYVQYEISNFAKEGFECVHNLSYWKNESWWAFGPSAAGHIDGLRWRNVSKLTSYLNSECLPPIENVEELSGELQIGEMFMMGLRITDGMDKELVDNLICRSTNCWRQTVIDKYISEGWLQWRNGKLALTPDGILFTDTVVSGLLMQEGAMADTNLQ